MYLFLLQKTKNIQNILTILFYNAQAKEGQKKGTMLCEQKNDGLLW